MFFSAPFYFICIDNDNVSFVVQFSFPSTQCSPPITVTDILIRRVHSVGSNVANSIPFALFVGSDFSDSIGRPLNDEYSRSEARFFGCWIFHIGSAVRRMPNIRHPKLAFSNVEFRHLISRSSNVEYSTYQARFFEIF